MENKKKKVLFVITEFPHGGSNKTLENYLPLIDKERFEISIFCHTSSRREGYYYELFKPYLIQRNWLGKLVRENALARKVTNVLFRFLPSLERTYSRYEARNLQRHYQFDTVVGFQEHGTTEYATFFPCSHRVAWLHAFVAQLAEEGMKDNYEKTYKKFDSIVCVSDSLKKYFSTCFPALAPKAVRIYNPLDTAEATRLAQAAITEKDYGLDRFTLLSIGRLDPVKNFHLIPRMARDMKQAGAKPFRWYIMGAKSNDSYRQYIERKTEEYGVQDEVVLLGSRDNPYPYIAKSQLVVCLSQTESFSYVLNEAMVLHVPVASNNFPVASEVIPTDCGCVTSLDEMSTVLCRLINNEDASYDCIRKGVAAFTYDNTEIAQQFNSIL